MIKYLLISGHDPKYRLESAESIKQLDFSLVAGYDDWSIWVECEKLVCLARVGWRTRNTTEWWNIAISVRSTLMDHENLLGGNTQYYLSLSEPIISFD